ncbi:MAG TPA: SusC/RagA family TonB-linked outer membrane protein, partial [Arachidicoccus sp.]|nr:SusC/RagA family TonB-linked outer membrane protein [Arachidicoccus sp.]
MHSKKPLCSIYHSVLNGSLGGCKVTARPAATHTWLKPVRLVLICLLLLITSVQYSYGQSKTINGTVLDAVTGKPLAGASVELAGTTTGTSTDSLGEFSLLVSSIPCTITVHYVGYQQITQVVKNTTVTVGLTSAEQADLNDVVVVGYGNQKARNVTGAISSLNTENFDERPINRLEQGLVGQIPGVRVQTTSGIPGAAMSINIRGAGSMGAGNEPLYVIDGFPLTTTSQNSAGNWSSGSPLDNINPNDIASIEVLKDAAAAAIYGSRAANGVVIITTKKGKLGKNKINVNAYYGASKEGKRLDMLSSQQWIDRAKGWIDDNWVASGPDRTANQTTAERQAIVGKLDPKLMYDVRWDEPGHPGLDYIDWQDMAFRNGNFQNYQLSSSGGTKNVRYYISGNYQYQKGYVIGLDYKTYSARANVEATLAKGIKFGLNLAPSYSIQNNPGVEGKDNTLHKIIGTTPVMENTPNENGALYQSAYPWGSSGTNPIPRLENRVGRYKNFRTIATTYLDVDLISHVKFRTSLNFSNSDRTSQSYLPSDNLESIKGTYGTDRTQTLVNENTISYTNTFAEKHNLNVVVGHSYNTYNNEGSGITSDGNYDNYFTQVVPANSNGSSDAT